MLEKSGEVAEEIEKGLVSWCYGVKVILFARYPFGLQKIFPFFLTINELLSRDAKYVIDKVMLIEKVTTPNCRMEWLTVSICIMK